MPRPIPPDRRAGRAAKAPPAIDGPMIVGVLLGGITGFVDGIDYPRYHAFGAAMSGNVALIGIRLSGAEARSPLAAAFPLAGFVAGCIVARIVIDRFSAAWSLAIEAALLAYSALAPPTAIAALVATSVAMGVQNTTFASFGGVKANTTFVTGDLDRLAQTVVELFDPRLRVTRRLVSLVVPLIVLYVVGAFLGGLAVRHLTRPLWIPAALVLAVALITARTARPAASGS